MYSALKNDNSSFLKVNIVEYTPLTEVFFQSSLHALYQKGTTICNLVLCLEYLRKERRRRREDYMDKHHVSCGTAILLAVFLNFRSVVVACLFSKIQFYFEGYQQVINYFFNVASLLLVFLA